MAQPSPKLQQIAKDFQQIASMAGYLNSAFDPPQLRLNFTMYARLSLRDEAQGLALMPRLRDWCDRMAVSLRENSSSAILPPLVNYASPQPMPSGETWYMVATLNFNTKVTENSYQRVRSAVLGAYQAAALLRERGLSQEEPHQRGDRQTADQA
nr:hypothetical protein [uncultured Holophaga sp.]